MVGAAGVCQGMSPTERVLTKDEDGSEFFVSLSPSHTRREERNAIEMTRYRGQRTENISEKSSYSPSGRFFPERTKLKPCQLLVHTHDSLKSLFVFTFHINFRAT